MLTAYRHSLSPACSLHDRWMHVLPVWSVHMLVCAWHFHNYRSRACLHWEGGGGKGERGCIDLMDLPELRILCQIFKHFSVVPPPPPEKALSGPQPPPPSAISWTWSPTVKKIGEGDVPASQISTVLISPVTLYSLKKSFQWAIL